MNRRHADFQSGAILDKTDAYGLEARQTGLAGSNTYGRFVKPASSAITSEKENLGALAGATESNLELAFKTEYYRNRAARATELGHAIAECHPQDACILMEAAIDDLRAGMPNAPFLSLMNEASFWADMATRNERKAFALANYTRLSKADQSAFLAYVQRGAAA